MDDSVLPTVTESSPAAHPKPERPHPWPAMMSFLAAWLFPGTTACRTCTAPLHHAYGVHLLAAVATFLLVIVLVAIGERRDPLTIFANDILREFDRDWQEALLVTMLIVFLVESGFVVLALIVLPWGARDEPLASSWAHALRQTWLHSPHALPTVLAIGLLLIGHDRLKRSFYSSSQAGTFPTYSMPPAPVCPPNPTAQQSANYQKALNDWQQQSIEANQKYMNAWQAYYARMPFLIRYGEIFVAQAGFLAGVWVLWALFRAVGTARPTPPVHRPPLCEFCGYNLVATPSDSRCPECGELVAGSVGPDARPGAPWEHRRERGLFRAWWASELQPVLAPARFGRTVQVCSSSTAHRLFLAGHMPVIFAVTATATVLSCQAVSPRSVWEDEDGLILWGIAPMFGVLSACVCLALAMLTAALVGMIYTLTQGRNLLPATVQIGSYLAGCLTLWACGSAAWSVLTALLVNAGRFRAWRQPYGLDPDLLAFCFWVGPTGLGFFLIYVIPLWKATASTRYANK